jgi:hypothetical protein
LVGALAVSARFGFVLGFVGAFTGVGLGFTFGLLFSFSGRISAVLSGAFDASVLAWAQPRQQA